MRRAGEPGRTEQVLSPLCQTVRSVYLNVVLAHRELSSVGEVHQQGERQGVDIVDGDVSQVLLRHVV